MTQEHCQTLPVDDSQDIDMTEILDEGVADGKMCKTVYEKSKVLNSEKTISYRREKPVSKQIA